MQAKYVVKAVQKWLAVCPLMAVGMKHMKLKPGHFLAHFIYLIFLMICIFIFFIDIESADNIMLVSGA